MKNLKVPAFALAFVMAVISAFAFNTKPVEVKKPYTVYYYSGNATLTQLRDINKYGTSSVTCNAGSNAPCTFNWSGTQQDFQDHIEAFPSVNQAKMEAASLKN